MRRILGIGLAALVAFMLAGCAASGGSPAVRTATEAPPPAAPVETPEPDVSTIQAPALPSSYSALSSRNWALVVKSPDKYVGKGYKLWACITQFDAATGASSFRGLASYRAESDWYVGTNTFFAGKESALASFVQGDAVAMSVVSMGSFSYDTQIGGNTTAPLFWVAKIKRISGSC